MSNILLATLRERCPFCERGKIFHDKKSFFQVPVMKDNCPSCGKDLNGEPGYFFGAMYVSYGISVAIGIATYIITRYVLKITSLELTVAIIVFSAVISSYKNFKWSRILWLKLFPPGKGTNFFGGGDKPV